MICGVPSRHLVPSVRTLPLNRVAKMAVPRASAADLPPPIGFEDPSCSTFSVAIMGDLHLPQTASEMGLFHAARDQLKEMTTTHGDSARIVQLGDLGSYDKGWPGSRACFSLAHEYLSSFDLPTALVLGNHDLEADEFETDPENLAAWHEAFSQRHYWSAKLGLATLVGLSTVRFRSNQDSVHEVHIDDEQIAFLEETLKKAAGGPVILFTHAPIMGSGLKVVQAVHVKNRCAWLNHSCNPQRFLRLVEKYPNIKLWFSGHFHLSQSYPDSISLVGGTAFVLTGVIGDTWSRDGHRHSRLLNGTSKGYELYTVDHDAGTMRLDLSGEWEGTAPPQYLVPEEEFLCDASSGFLCSSAGEPGCVPWFNSGGGYMLCLKDKLLIEYDVETMSPIGAVFLEVPEGSVVRLVDAEGREVGAMGEGDGSAAVAVEVLDGEIGSVMQRVERNDAGGFYQVFQANKWVARKKKEAAKKAAAAAASGV